MIDPVELSVLTLPCRLRLLLATYRRLLVVFSLADFRENSGPCTGALESAQSTVKALVILNSDLRHLLHTPFLIRHSMLPQNACNVANYIGWTVNSQ